MGDALSVVGGAIVCDYFVTFERLFGLRVGFVSVVRRMCGGGVMLRLSFLEIQFGPLPLKFRPQSTLKVLAQFGLNVGPAPQKRIH